MAALRSQGAHSGRTGPARFIDPGVLARIGKVELIAKTVVDGFISGLHRAAHPGISMDFAEHRAYMPGDDVRRIDWRVYARTDRLYVKEYEADTNANVSVVLDVSRSMDFGEHISKLDYGRFLGASVCYLANRQRDRVGLVTFDDDLVEIVPPSAKHLEIILHTLDRLDTGGASDYGVSFRKLAQSLTRRSVLVLVSDFYTEPGELAKAVGELKAGGNDLIVFQVLDPAELEFPFSEPASFEDLETGATIETVPERLKARYRARLREHVNTIERQCTGHRIEYALLDTSMPLDQALFQYLTKRQRLSRGARR